MRFKYWIMLIMVCIGLFSFYTLSQAKEDGVSWDELSEKHPLKQEKIFTNHQNLQHLFLFPEGSFDTGEALSIVKSIYRLPSSMLDKLVDEEVKVKLFNGRLTENPSAAYLKGVQPRGYKNEETTWDDVPGMGGSHTVFVKIGASDQGNGHGSVNLELHELAHSIDKIVYNGIRDDIEFLGIWKKEVGTLFPNQTYFNDYPEEYFAEVFAMYYVNSEQRHRLEGLAPQTYMYIKQLD